MSNVLKRGNFMTIRSIIVLLSLLLVNVLAANASKVKNYTIDQNTLLVVGEVTETMSNTFIEELYASESDTVLVYIKSPGGSMDAGIKMVDYMEKSGKTIICVAEFAASAAQSILQACTIRVGSTKYNGMQHRAYIPNEYKEAGKRQLRMSGYTEEEIMKFINDLETAMRIVDDERIVKEAKRQGLTFEEFVDMFKPEVWFYHYDAVKRNNLDSIGTITCTKELWKEKACPITK